MTTNVLIAGYGKLGQLFSERVRDHSIFALSRSAKPTPGNVDYIIADLQDNSARNFVDNVPLPTIDYVFYTATPGMRTEEAYRTCYIDGLKNLCRNLDLEGVKRFFFVSSTSVYGENSGAVVSEIDTPNPTRFSGKVILEAEQWLRQQAFSSTSIRFAGIYGGNRNMLIRHVSTGKHLELVTDAYTNRIHEQDCAGVMAHLLKISEQGKSPIADIYNGLDGDCALKSEVYNFIAEHLSQQTILPGQGSLQGKRCSNQRLLDTGYQYQYPSYRDGYLEMLR